MLRWLFFVYFPYGCIQKTEECEFKGICNQLHFPTGVSLCILALISIKVL